MLKQAMHYSVTLHYIKLNDVTRKTKVPLGELFLKICENSAITSDYIFWEIIRQILYIKNYGLSIRALSKTISLAYIPTMSMHLINSLSSIWKSHKVSFKNKKDTPQIRHLGYILSDKVFAAVILLKV